MQIPSKERISGEEFVVSVCVLVDTQNLKVTAGKLHVTIKFHDLTNYMGARAKRGNLLTKGYHNLSKIEAVD
jgi:topoisomerase-4 subunit A